ncbi:hypothetical protein AB0K60_13320 [Thermopolyspora sp. NPDC052614]|uniref:hypothetical protein n=1 Tax=Thermopolyspora sp. NPDC052614 TaxID=3155682 RepID=UPI00341DDAF0
MTALETIVRRARFGVRFWDPVTAGPADARFLVRLRPSTGGRVVTASPTRAGTYALHTLPEEDGPARRHRVEVSDPDGHYLPFSFEATLPFTGLFTLPCGGLGSPPSPPDLPGPPNVPVFAAPTRPVPAGAAVVRAHLRSTTGEPASWATLEVRPPGGPTALGVADADGQVCVLFAYPEPPIPAPSPAGPGLVPLSGQTWRLDLLARYGREPGSPAGPVAAPSASPDICDVLDQLPARLLADESTTLSSASLRYGRELTLTTAGRSVLLLAPHPGRLHA